MRLPVRLGQPRRAVLGLAVVLAIVWLALSGWLASSDVWAAPSEAAPLDAAPALRDRDEDLRIERFLPPAAVLLGVGGIALARRRGAPGAEHAVRLATPLLALALALGPLMMIGPRPLNRQPSPDAQEYADAARHLAAGDGYLTTIYRNEVRAPRYPPGFSATLAPFALAGRYPDNVQLGSKLYAMLYLVATLAAGWAIAGPLAGGVAVALVGSSPFAVRYASLVMSDAFAAGLTVLVLALVHRPSTRRMLLAGVLAGALILTRLSSLAVVPALLLCVAGWRSAAALLAPDSLRWRGAIVAGALVGILALGLQQWASFGSPFTTGYQYWLPEIRSFGLDYPLDPEIRRDGSGIVADSLDGVLLRWICPCPEDDPLMAFRAVVFYPLVLLGVFWIFTPPLATIPGLLEVWRRRREPGPAFVLWLTTLTVGFQVFYFYLGARFVAAPATLLAVYSGVAIARWLECLCGSQTPPPAPPATADLVQARSP